MLVKKLWPSFVWALVILALMGFPGRYFPEVHNFWEWLGPDKLVHLAVFGLLAFLVFLNLRTDYENSSNKRLFAFLVLTGILAYGLLVEVLQAKVFIGRDGNVYDFIANGIGVLLGWFAFNMLKKKKIKI